MLKVQKSSLTLCLLGVLAGCSSQPETKVGSCLSSTSKPASYVAALAELRQIPGIAVAIGKEQELVWTLGHGIGSVAENSAIDPEVTKFRIGSVSKTLTAFAVARLMESNRVDIDAPVHQLLPLLPGSYDGVNIRNLAGHLSGVRHYSGDAELGSNVEYPTSQQALEIFVNDPLLSTPGSEFSYSTYGYTVISAALEELTGKSFLSLMDDEVFGPLGMANTMADTASISVPARTEFYYLGNNNELIVGSPINSSYKWAGGGFLSTAVDLARFGMAHFDSTRLSEESRNLLWQSQRTNDGKETDYGFGWSVDEASVEHGGGALGGSTLLRIYPKQQIVIAITANLSMRGPNQFGDLPDQLYQCVTEG